MSQRYSMRVRVDKEGNFGVWGPLSWANLLDWFICLQVIFILVLSAWASVRGVSTPALTLPLIAIMCLSHALWVCVNEEKPLRISQVPFLFLPLLLWVGFRVNAGLSSEFAACEWLCWLQLFIFFWILSNHGRLRAQTKVLCALAIGLVLWACLGPLWDRQLIGEAKLKLVEGDLAQVVAISAKHHMFASSALWGAYVVLCVPAFCVTSLLPRLESVARILYAFLVLFCLYVLASHHVFWAWAIVLVAVAYLLFCFGQLAKGVRKGLLLLLVGFAVVILSFAFYFEAARVAELEFSGLESIGVGAFLWGLGRGTWLPVLADSSHLLVLFRSDAALICFQYGLIGLLMGLVPYLYMVRQSWLTYQSYPSLSSRGRGRQKLVKYERFCLLIALATAVVAILNFFYALSLYEPAYGLLLILALSLLVKLGFRRRVHLPDRAGFKRIYMLVFVLVAVYLLIASAQ